MVWGDLVPSESGRRFMVQGERLCLPLHCGRGVEGKDFWRVEWEEREKVVERRMREEFGIGGSTYTGRGLDE
jgi:hypothetical protein